LNLVADHAGEPIERIKGEILDSVQQFTCGEDLVDDIALMILARN